MSNKEHNHDDIDADSDQPFRESSILEPDTMATFRHWTTSTVRLSDEGLARAGDKVIRQEEE